MTGQRIIAGTLLQIALKQHAVSRGYRPDSVSIYEEEEPLVSNLLRRLRKPSRRLVTRLELTPCRAGGALVAQTTPWPLTVPRIEKGRSKVIAALDAAFDCEEQYTISVSTKSVTRSELIQRPVVEIGGFDVAGVSTPSLCVAPASNTSSAIEIVAAADPVVRITALTPDMQEFWDYLDAYFGRIAMDNAIDRQSLFYSLREMLPYDASPQLERPQVRIAPQQLVLDAGQSEVINISISHDRPPTSSAAPPGPQNMLAYSQQLWPKASGELSSDYSTLMVLRLIEAGTGLTTYSDFLKVRRNGQVVLFRDGPRGL